MGLSRCAPQDVLRLKCIGVRGKIVSRQKLANRHHSPAARARQPATAYAPGPHSGRTAALTAPMLVNLSLLALAVLFVAGGLNHFVNPRFYLSMMPPYLPAHALLVQVSGVLEVVGGLALLWPVTRLYAGYGLIALLVAIFPANLHMALHPENFPKMPVWGLYLRLPLQGGLIAWVYWATIELRRG